MTKLLIQIKFWKRNKILYQNITNFPMKICIKLLFYYLIYNNGIKILCESKAKCLYILMIWIVVLCFINKTDPGANSA